MKKIKPEDFRVSESISLQKLPTHLALSPDEDEIKDELKKVRKKLSKLQDKMYAHDRYSVLVCLQGMDTSGKDSLIREVFKEFNPRGVVVHSFKTPTSTELEHDYLWRHYIALPERGKITVFNRTHYENVLVTRVHPEYVLNENIPGIEKVEDITPEFWENRFESIQSFEKHIASNGIIVLKFYLHLSKEEQRLRLLRRLEQADDNWKFSTGDLKERALWEEYVKYYEEAINKTSTEKAPWFVVPADDKPSARYIVAKILLEVLEQYSDMAYPELDQKVQDNIHEYQRALENE